MHELRILLPPSWLGIHAPMLAWTTVCHRQLFCFLLLILEVLAAGYSQLTMSIPTLCHVFLLPSDVREGGTFCSRMLTYSDLANPVRGRLSQWMSKIQWYRLFRNWIRTEFSSSSHGNGRYPCRYLSAEPCCNYCHLHNWHSLCHEYCRFHTLGYT